jgi:hypothetical protein
MLVFCVCVRWCSVVAVQRSAHFLFVAVVQVAGDSNKDAVWDVQERVHADMSFSSLCHLYVAEPCSFVCTRCLRFVLLSISVTNDISCLSRRSNKIAHHQRQHGHEQPNLVRLVWPLARRMLAAARADRPSVNECIAFLEELDARRLARAVVSQSPATEADAAAAAYRVAADENAPGELVIGLVSVLRCFYVFADSLLVIA